MRHTVIGLFLLLIAFSTQAQEDWIVMLEGDTIFGKVDFMIKKPYEMDEVVVKVNKKKQRFSPLEVSRLSKKGEAYVPLKIYRKYQFAQVVSEGYLSWYKFINPESPRLSEFSLSVLTKLDGSIVPLSNIGFMRYVSNYLDDCQPLEAKIENNEFKQKDLPEVIAFYNDWIEKNTSNIYNASPKPTKSTTAIDAVISSASKNETLGKDEELLDMLSDVQSKLKDGKTIPAYLKAGILDKLKDDGELAEQFKSALE